MQERIARMTPQQRAARRDMMAYLQCEGYDDAGRLYPTLAAWLARRPEQDTPEPEHGGRGVGTYGVSDV